MGVGHFFVRVMRWRWLLLLTFAAAHTNLYAAPAGGKPAKGKTEAAETAPADDAEAAEPDPVADAWRAYGAKRRLQHAIRADDVTQRSSERMARLVTPPNPPRPATAVAPGNPPAPQRPAAPPAPAQLQGGWLGTGVARFGYVRRVQAPSTRHGVVVLVDERARVPGEANVLASLADELTRNGWEIWSLALPEAAAPVYPRRSRTRYVPPAVDPDAEPSEEAEAEPEAAAAAPPPKLVRRRWATTPPARAAASNSGASAPGPQSQGAQWQQWRTQSQARIAQIVGAVQAEARGATTPIILLGAGLGANLVAEVGQQQGIAALVLLDLTRPPDGMVTNLDGIVAALQAPTLVLNWRRSDIVGATAWQRTQDETRVDVRGAPEAQLARRLRGWLQREFVD